MNTRKLPFDISPRRQGYIALLLWGAALALLLHRSLFGIEESAARGLLLSWSIADHVASSVATLGMPDLRILLFLPTGYLWTGNVFAAKVLTAALLAAAAWLLYAWRSRAAGAEGALLATGLLLISPLALTQVDAVGTGVYLLAAFAAGGWLDVRYRANPRPFNGWYFAQVLVCAFSVSLHPAGLAYPLALLASWRTLPAAGAKHRSHFLGGILFSAAFVVALRMGWGELAWFQNPLHTLSAAFGASGAVAGNGEAPWLVGATLLVLAGAVVLVGGRELWSDLTGRTLLIGLLGGALVGDPAWGMVVLATVLYFGIPLLLRIGKPSPEAGFMRQRGWVLVLLLAGMTLFMRADMAFFEAGRRELLSAQDELIKALASAAEDERNAADAADGERKRRFIVASEWPGRTMLACRCDTLPLPPVESDPETQLSRLRGVTHLLLDPRRTANIDLARNLALLGGAVETVALQPGGVLLHVKETTAQHSEGKTL